MSVDNRFWSKVNKANDCWLWTGGTNAGYGMIRINGYSYRTHVLAWKWASEIQPTRELVVCHTCDDRACVKNDEKGIYIVDGIELLRYGHLFLGTREQNTRDAVNKLRHTGRPRK